MKPRLAIIGAGWAGLAAAIPAVEHGCEVTVYEASRQLGGRARSLEVTLADGQTAMLDNGQHIMVGAYTQTLALMEQVGIDPAGVFHAMPLALRLPHGTGLALPAWPAPWDAAWGIATARGWSWRDRLSLVRSALKWRLAGFQCSKEASVLDVAREVTPRVMHELIEPLCVSALNTPPAQASGTVFLRVLRDSLFGSGWGRWGGSWLLVPKVPLGELFPDGAARWLAARGVQIRLGHRVEALQGSADAWLVDGQDHDAVLLACPVWEAVRLLANHDGATHWATCARGLAHEPIATVYTSSRRRLPSPLLVLRSSHEAPAQFVFDRGQLGGPAGLLAFVVSASRGDRDTLQQQVIAQAHALGWTDVEPLQTVVEKRAAFACTPGVARPGLRIAPGLWACGDYVTGPYPATLEGAVRAARQAADGLAAELTAARRTARPSC